MASGSVAWEPRRLVATTKPTPGSFAPLPTFETPAKFDAPFSGGTVLWDKGRMLKEHTDSGNWLEFIADVTGTLREAFLGHPDGTPPPWAALDVMCIIAGLHTAAGRARFARSLAETAARCAKVVEEYTDARLTDDLVDSEMVLFALTGSIDVPVEATAAPFSGTVPMGVLLRALVPSDTRADADGTWAVQDRDERRTATHATFWRAEGRPQITQSTRVAVDPDAVWGALVEEMREFVGNTASLNERLTWAWAGFTGAGTGPGDARTPVHRRVVALVMLYFRWTVAEYVCTYVADTRRRALAPESSSDAIRLRLGRAFAVYREFHALVRKTFWVPDLRRALRPAVYEVVRASKPRPQLHVPRPPTAGLLLDVAKPYDAFPFALRRPKSSAPVSVIAAAKTVAAESVTGSVFARDIRTHEFVALTKPAVSKIEEKSAPSHESPEFTDEDFDELKKFERADAWKSKNGRVKPSLMFKALQSALYDAFLCVVNGVSDEDASDADQRLDDFIVVCQEFWRDWNRLLDKSRGTSPSDASVNTKVFRSHNDLIMKDVGDANFAAREGTLNASANAISDFILARRSARGAPDKDNSGSLITGAMKKLLRVRHNVLMILWNYKNSRKTTIRPAAWGFDVGCVDEDYDDRWHKLAPAQRRPIVSSHKGPRISAVFLPSIYVGEEYVVPPKVYMDPFPTTFTDKDESVLGHVIRHSLLAEPLVVGPDMMPTSVLRRVSPADSPDSGEVVEEEEEEEEENWD